MIDDGSVVSHGLPDGEDGDLQEGEHLAHDQPDVDHPDVGGGGQLVGDCHVQRVHHQHGRDHQGDGSLEMFSIEINSSLEIDKLLLLFQI